MNNIEDYGDVVSSFIKHTEYECIKQMERLDKLDVWHKKFIKDGVSKITNKIKRGKSYHIFRTFRDVRPELSEILTEARRLYGEYINFFSDFDNNCIYWQLNRDVVKKVYSDYKKGVK